MAHTPRKATKDLAKLVNNVVNNKANPKDVENSVYSNFKLFEKRFSAEHDAFMGVLEASFQLASLVRQQDERIASLEKEIRLLKSS